MYKIHITELESRERFEAVVDGSLERVEPIVEALEAYADKLRPKIGTTFPITQASSTTKAASNSGESDNNIIGATEPDAGKSFTSAVSPTRVSAKPTIDEVLDAARLADEIQARERGASGEPTPEVLPEAGSQQLDENTRNALEAARFVQEEMRRLGMLKHDVQRQADREPELEP
ncbi:MAG: hypothetical protein GC137_03610 [Alphaproteobacteria bacterium]|nr:hypothetical protein [Alphaproteobacteria bacterium]